MREGKERGRKRKRERGRMDEGKGGIEKWERARQT